MVGVVEEDVLVGGVGRHVAVTRLHVVGVFGGVPLHGRTGRRAGYGVALGSLYPTVGHAVVAQLLDDGVVALVRVLGFGRRTLHRGHSRRCAQLAVVVLALSFYLHHTHLVVFLPGRDDVRAAPVGVLEYACTYLGGYAPVADEVVLGETPARDAEYGCGVDGVVLRLVEGEALRRAVDVHALKIAVALHDALASGVVGVAAGLDVVRQCHEAVLLVPCHAPLRVQAVVLHECGVAVGVVGVTFVPNLRGRGGMVGVTVFVCQRVAARNRTRVGALHLGERLTHPNEGYHHFK